MSAASYLHAALLRLIRDDIFPHLPFFSHVIEAFDVEDRRDAVESAYSIISERDTVRVSRSYR